MKVGDLVQLSAKGAKVKANHSFVGGIGIVMELKPNGYYDLAIQWIPKKGQYRNRLSWFKRYEIKKVKASNIKNKKNS